MGRHRTDEGTNRRPQDPPPSVDPISDPIDATDPVDPILDPGDATDPADAPPEPGKPDKSPASHHSPLGRPGTSA